MLLSFCAQAQKKEYTTEDTLKGSNSEARECFDVVSYGLKVKVEPEIRFISGSNTITFQVKKPTRQLQLNLFENMEIDSVAGWGQELSFRRRFTTFWVSLPFELQPTANLQSITVYFRGQPQTAKNAPWDGGFVWQKDNVGNDWVGVACQGEGASLWYPCKDHVADKPDSVQVALSVPSQYTGVSNGKLYGVNYGKEWDTYLWKVSYPIHSYNVTLNVARYSLIKDEYVANDGSKLPLHYYVLNYNVEEAKKHFQQVKGMLKVYEELFGKYPFWQDGFKLVETHYWGMEHQSCVAYGNKYRNNEFGFDFIIIHESGHEYWGNLVSMADRADMWIHESFCTYTEALYVEKLQGPAAMLRYLDKQKKLIQNKSPLLGDRDVAFNFWQDSDMYYRGAWMLHTLRNMLNDDPRWFTMLKNLCTQFAHQPTTSEMLVDAMCREIGKPWQSFIFQYLTEKEPPLLDIKPMGKDSVAIRWNSPSLQANYPVIFKNKTGELKRLDVKHEWQTFYLPKTWKLAGDLLYVREK
jgi:aminopeptidase N